MFPSVTWIDAFRAARCEGLDYLPFMGADWYPDERATAHGEIRRADFVIDLGPEGGPGGGRLVAAGPPEVIAASPGSHTGAALRAAGVVRC